MKLNISFDHSRSIDSNLKNILYQLNNLSDTDTNDNENLPNFKYRDVSYFSNLDRKLKLKCLSFFHLRLKSSSRNFDNLNYLTNDLNVGFDFSGFSRKSKLKLES